MTSLARSLPLTSVFIQASIALALACCLFSFAAPYAQAASLSQEQAQSVRTLLQSYGVDDAHITKALMVVQDQGGGPGEQGKSQGMNAAAPKKCPAPLRAVGPGAQNDDVKSLQARLTQEGLLSNDDAKGFFGSTTQTALMRWQQNHDVVTSGTPETTGFGKVGPKTLEALMRPCDEGRGMMPPENASSTAPHQDNQFSSSTRPRLERPRPQSSLPSNYLAAAAVLTDSGSELFSQVAAVYTAPFQIATDALTDLFVYAGIGQ